MTRQRQVGDEFYEYYSGHRLRLIRHLHANKGFDIETAIRVGQKLIDRVLFIAFCEGRGVIQPRTIETAVGRASRLAKVRNPVWRSFLELFRAVGCPGRLFRKIDSHHSSLFGTDDLIDGLDLDDVPWTDLFRRLARYDYAREVNVDVLGQLFERSVAELERLREGALLAKDTSHTEAPMMPKSPQRKLFGIYYTPVEFTSAIVAYTVDEVVAERLEAVRRAHKLTDEQLREPRKAKAAKAFWRACLEAMKRVTVCDPACGGGAFLIEAYEAIYRHYAHILTELQNLGARNTMELCEAIPDLILAHNLYGVDLQPEAVETAQLALWLRTAQPGGALADLSSHIICGNSLTEDPAVHARAMKWQEAFPRVFSGDHPGFDCVIGNPPWERLKLQEREFFALAAPEIASTVNAADRRRRIAKLKTANPALHARYLDAQSSAERMLAYVRRCERFPLSASGDINAYLLFAELAAQIVAPHGRVGLLVPSGIATDKTSARFFEAIMAGKRLHRLYDFENRRRVFPDVDGRFKFTILDFGGSEVRRDTADFVFFAHGVEELEERKRHIPLSAADMKLMNPNTGTCPIFRDRQSAEITRAVYRRVPVLIDRNRKQGGNPWGARFMTMFHQTNDAELFTTADELKRKRYQVDRNRWTKGKSTYLPLYEAKMVQAYDHRAASVEVVEANWVRQGQTVETTLVEHQNPEHLAMPRWWVNAEVVAERLKEQTPPALLCYKDVTSPTNQRTMIASFIPPAGVVNSAPLVFTEGPSLRRQCCLLANLNSLAYDFIARQKVGNVHLNFFIVEQLPTFPPDAYDDRCPWSSKQTLERWISNRVLKLSCTADDMKPLAEACGFEPPVHKWKPAEREQLLAELDAAYFVLYGLERDDVLHVLSTFQGTRGEQRAASESEAQDALSPAGRRIVDAYDALTRQS
ncbi:MAG: N-6 DNA methylase [Phycisphaerae bacterium]|nr:N-6 DNA methylase [Phycisphaerae bacterium]